MAIIYSYPNAQSVVATNQLIGTQIDPVTEENKTVQFTIAEIAAFANTSPGYTVYTALVTQAGVAAPTATVLQNSITGTLTWARTGAGVYTLTSNGTAFTVNKTILFLNVGNGEANQMLMWTRTSSSVITLNTNGADDRITAGAFELRVYS
jgi:hypothetical protein|tara:strand:- start:378 stop:830 length:453 start_codon:yes stop_codon:yes gene_type:complete